MKRIIFLIAPIAALGTMVASCNKSLTADKMAANTQVTTLAGISGVSGSTNGPNLTATFATPYSIAVDTMGNVYVGDMESGDVRVINPIWGVSLLASQNPAQLSELYIEPTGLAVDASGTVYCVDYGSEDILKISPSGVVSLLAGDGNPGSADGTGKAASFADPYGDAVDAAGNVYVADGDGDMIRKIFPSGVVTTVAGTPFEQGAADGIGSAASFSDPRAVAVDKQGNLYVADSQNNTIRKISPSGVVMTLAGNSQTHGGYADGIGTNAVFNNPSGIALDKYGNIYVSDSQNNMIRKIDQQGDVTTFAGTGQRGSANGLASAATFNNPIGIAVDSAGNVYVADSGNNLIRKINITQ